MRRSVAIFVFVSLWIGLEAPARADDTIRLFSGGSVTGVIIDESDEDVTVRTKRGNIQVIQRSDIYRIDRGGDASQDFAKKKAALRAHDVEGHASLARWASEKGLETESRELYQRVIELDPEHRVAREALGYRRHDGRWMTEEAYQRDVNGLVAWDGRWVTPEERGFFEMGFQRNEKGEWYRPAAAERIAKLPPRPPAERPSTGGEKPRTGETAPPVTPPQPPEPAVDVYEPAPRDPGELAWFDDHEAVPWDQAKVYESRYYLIRTNIKAEYAQRYMKMLDQYYIRFVEVFELKPEATAAKSEVWIYASHQEFMSATGMAEGVGGFYNTGTRRVTAYHGRFGQNGTTQEVLAHEATHQFQDKVIPFRNCPIWLLEGMAVFFESAYYDPEKNKVKTGTIPKDRLSHLKQGIASGDYIPLAELIRTPQASFTGYHYAHAWSFIYMLLCYGDKKAQKKNQAVFSELFYRTRQGYVSAEDVEALFGGKDKFAEFEALWKQWVLDLPYDFDPTQQGGK